MTPRRLTRHGLAAGALALLATTAAPAAAQHEGHSPYAGVGSAEVKTLTADEVTDLLEGAGMGLARPAELNSYPGPRHVLELADSLALTEEQLERTRTVFGAMRDRAVELGQRIVERETALDEAFASGADARRLEALTREVARLRGELRWTHLRAHLRMREIVSPHQRHEYDRLRGYGGHDHGH